MDQLLARKYFFLTITLVLLLVVVPLLGGVYQGRIVFELFLTLVLMATFFAVFTDSRLRAPAIGLGVPTFVGQLTGFVVPGLPPLPLEVGFHMCATLFFLLTVWSILRKLHTAKEVTNDSIYGSLCGYLLLGLAFSHLFCVVELLVPGSYIGPAIEAGSPLTAGRRHFYVLSYFSFSTLTTLGYGDVTPGSPAVRSLAIVEAIAGQFYIAVLVADIIGKRVSQAIADRKSDASE